MCPFTQMLPFGGQGSNQAMEDGGALGYLLRGVEDATAIPARLAMFDTVRRNRASRVQTLSKVRVGREKEVEQELKKYVENADAGKHNKTLIKGLGNRCADTINLSCTGIIS